MLHVFETNDFNGDHDKSIDNYDSDDEGMINGVPGGNSWKLWNNSGAPLACRCSTMPIILKVGRSVSSVSHHLHSAATQ